MRVQDAYALVEKLKPECKLLECLEFDDFYAFFMVPRSYLDDGVAGSYYTVNKKTGLLGMFNPTENLSLYMSGEVIEVEAVINK